MKGWKAMQKEKHEGIAVFMYLGVLLFITIINLFDFDKASFLDMIYLVVVLSCVLKFLFLYNDCYTNDFCKNTYLGMFGFPFERIHDSKDIP